MAAESTVEIPAAVVDDVQSPADISDSVQSGTKNSPCALELFAGSCKLSKALKSHGFAAFGIDHQKCKNRVGPCVIMDLSKKSSRVFIKKMLKSGRVGAVPMAPPCGTSSRARERPIPRRLRRLGVPQPKQLRSSQYPLQFPWLKGSDLVRTTLANKCYETVAEVFEECVKCKVYTFAENPANSRMWEVPCIKALFELEGVFFLKFHSCMHGGDRDKLTGLLHNCPALDALALRCDGQHEHRPWSVSRSLSGSWKFDTSLEAEYPQVLCNRLARVFAESCIKQGWVVHSEPRAVNSSKIVPASWRVAAGKQPRGRGFKQLLPEDGQVIEVKVTSPADVLIVKQWHGRSSQEVTLANRVFPKQSRMIFNQKANQRGEDGALSIRKRRIQDEDHLEDRQAESTVAVIGIPMTPQDAVRRAKSLRHPFDEAIKVPESMEKAMRMALEEGPEQVSRRRVEALKWIKQRARALEPEEKKLHDAMPEHRARVVQNKKFLLLKELIEEVGHEDKGLFLDLVSGMKITGNAEPTGEFAVDFKPAQLESRDLWQVAKFSQAEVVRRVPPHMNPKPVTLKGKEVNIAEEVWQTTMREVERGWLEGPLTAEQVSSRVGPLWTPSRRFGIVQGNKVRNIDDLSEFSVNQAYGTPEKLDLGGVDEVVAMAAAWAKMAEQTGHAEGVQLVGRCLDLKSAYKQIPLHDGDRAHAILSVFEPSSQQVRFFGSLVLPFGATGAVMSFNRVARALRNIMQRLLLLPVSNYFDDFPHVDTLRMADQSQAVMEQFLEVLGWQIATGVDKRIPAAVRFPVLGVVVDLSESALGIIRVENKPSRAEEMKEVIEEVEKERAMSPALAAKVQGRMMFAEAQCCGRWLSAVLEPVKRRALMPPNVKWITEELLESLKLCYQLMIGAPTRRIAAVADEDPCLVFTDGAYEDGVAGCGVVVFSSRAAKPLVMSFHIPVSILDQWKKDGHEQLIAQVELLPIVVVKRQFGHLLSSARVIYFIDNEGVKEALVAGVTKSQASKVMLHECMIQDSMLNNLSWYTRIPSPSNIADAPSRMKLDEIEELFQFDLVEPVLDYMDWGRIG